MSCSEGKQARLHEEARCRELAESRLAEVCEEISGHMQAILLRSGRAALEEWQAAPADSDRRELYTRLVHATQDPDVQVPLQLCAELLPHQLEGLEWLASLYANGLHGILADEMGLGKTIQTIALLLHLQERKGNQGPHLIVAPKSTLPNWQAEFGRFAPSFRVHLLAGDLGEREAELAALRFDASRGLPTACVTNYEQMHRNEWLLRNPWQLVIVDEGHRLKNPETVLHHKMVQLSCRMRLLLTGTPLQNNVGELWALLHYLLPELFTCSMDFAAWFAGPFRGIPGMNEFDVRLDPEQEHKVVALLHQMLSPFLLQRLKAETLADRLPPRVEATVRVPLSAWQREAYRDLERRTVRLLSSSGVVSSEQVNNALMQLRKISLHPYLFQEAYAKDEGLFRTSGKAEVLDRLLPKLVRFGHKVLIFSQFTSVLDILEDLLAWRGIASVRLDGQVPHKSRRERLERFAADPALSVFLLSARAGGLGLNLQAADTVILFDLDWNPQNDKQAVARVHRVGQTREVRVIRLVTHSAVERLMEQRCQEKLEMESKVMGAGMFRKQATADQRRHALRAVLGLNSQDDLCANKASSTQAGTLTSPGAPHASLGECCEGITSPEELNRLLARSNEEFATFEEMDAELLRPKKGVSSGEPHLIQCGRLMSHREVPSGFAAHCGGA